MFNSEKIKILKQNIIKLIITTKSTDEHFLFNFAKMQRKEMDIEISKGEMKTLINNILIEIKHKKLINDTSSLNHENFINEINSINNT